MTWDAYFELGHLIQLGAYDTVSKKAIIEHAKPVEFMSALAGIKKTRLDFSSDFTSVQHPILRTRFFLKSLKNSLENFFKTLQKALTSQRPAFDGVVLMGIEDENIPFFIRAVRKCNMETKFNSIVKGKN